MAEAVGLPQREMAAHGFPAENESRAVMALWAYRLAWSAPLIFVISTTGVLATRVIYSYYYPQKFLKTVPTISETSSHSPSADVFEWTMFASVLCIFVLWPLVFVMNRERLQQIGKDHVTWPLHLLNGASTALGLVAGVFLAMLGVVRLHDGPLSHDVHIDLSIFYYSTQVIAFLIDGIIAMWMRRVHTGLSGPVERRALRARAAIGVCATVVALWFLYMYLHRGGIWDLRTGQTIYVATEYALVLLCMLYPLAIFLELRRHYGLKAQALGLPLLNPKLAFEG